MSSSIQASTVIELDEIIEINTSTITQALCFEMSLTKKYCVVGTQNGVCLIDNVKKSFRRFENQKNPFRKQEGTGVQLGAALEQRSQIAVVPSKNSKKYKKTVVYIYDYQLNTILYSNDFFLPIRQLTLTDPNIILSNNRRLILYNYSNDTFQKNQKYYLSTYQSKQANTNIRYIDMLCEQRIHNNSIKQQQNQDQFTSIQISNLSYGNRKECLCGKYSISGVKPYKIVYAKVFTLNGSKMIQLSIYDAAYDRDCVFEACSWNQPFSFVISYDGSLVAYTQNYGKSVAVRKVNQKGVMYNLQISSSIKECLSHGFITYNDKTWYTTLRRGQKSTGSMHFFQLVKAQNNDQKQKTINIPKPRYTRYLSLFQKTIIDYGISNQLLGPDFYVHNGAVFSNSICGAVVEVLDFNLSGHHDKKTSENMIKLVEDFS